MFLCFELVLTNFTVRIQAVILEFLLCVRVQINSITICIVEMRLIHININIESSIDVNYSFDIGQTLIYITVPVPFHGLPWIVNE